MQKKLMNGLKKLSRNIASIGEKRGGDKNTFYKIIAELAQDSMFVIDRGLKVAFVNLHAAKQFNASPGQIVGKHLNELFPEKLASRYAEEIRSVFETGKHFAREDWAGFPERKIWLDTKLIPVKDDDGKINFVIGISRDFTDKKKIEQSLIETELVYDTLVDTSIDAVTICDLEGKIIAVSKQAIALHGYSEESELLNRSVWELVAPEFHSDAMYTLKRNIIENNPRPKSLEYTLLRKDGSRFEAEISSALLMDAQGNAKAFITICRDVSDKKRAEKVLTASEKRFKELWENAPVAYHTVDTRGIITSVNKTETKMLGYGVPEMVGREVFEFILPEQRADAKERFKKKIEDRAVSRSESRVYVRKDGSHIFVSIDDSLEHDHDGVITGMRTTMVDMTERKKAEEEVKRSLEKLQLSMESTILAMAKIVEMKDPYTAGHQRRVAQLAGAIGRELGLSKEQVSGIHMAAVIHDIGKIYVPAEILSKPGKLTEIEFGMIKTHPKVSYDILKMVEFPWPIAKIVLQHHERLDGSGYPLGLSGEDIMIEAKILSIADVVEAIAFHRPYRSAVGIDKALEEISEKKGLLYEAAIVDVCMGLFARKNFEFDKE